MFQADDYQALFNELGGVDPATGDNNTVPTGEAEPTANNTVNTNNAEPPVPNPEPAAEPATGDANPEPDGNADPNANPNAGAEPNPEGDEEAQRQARAFAEMRTTIGKYRNVFKKLQPLMGVDSEDAVIERLLNAGLNVQARTQGVDPEILRRMNALEEQNIAMHAEQQHKAVIESFGLLQKEFNLSNKEVIDFAKELDEKEIDLLKVGVDITTLYRGMHYNDMTQKQIETAKQKWIEEGSAANSAPGINPNTGKKNNQGKTEVNTMGELESVLNSLNKK